MTVTFEYEYLKELYEDGKSPDKKHRYLWKIHSLNYEVLSGDKAGRSSVRVNDQYRIEFTVNVIDNIERVTICNIMELSNHYK